MSYSTTASPAEPSPQPFVLSSPDRVLVRALPHSLASTNKKVTLSLRRTPSSSSSTSTSASITSPSLPFSPTSPTYTTISSSVDYLSGAPTNKSVSTSHSNVVSEPSTAPQNSQITNTQQQQHQRRNMISTLTSSIQEHDLLYSPTPRILQRPSPSPLITTAATSTTTSSGTRPSVSTVRKYSAQFHKNGMPIKSAMKTPPAVLHPPSTLGMGRPLSIRSHSSPVPLSSPKFVHFNTQLEHVRLFLQGETPSCVSERETLVDSRQHSMMSDIELTMPNWSPVSVEAFQRSVQADHHPHSGFSSVSSSPMRVEKVHLSEDQTELEGKILVQNIAFHKHVSVRYTADFWQTYTEVNAEYEESVSGQHGSTCGGAAVDRFSFEVPLEMEKSTVEKTFCMAVRYQVNGREFWDSNQGMNYQIECKRVVVVAQPASSLSSAAAMAMASGTAAGSANLMTTMTASDLAKHMNSLILGSPLPDYSKPVLKKKLANRYDLSTSLSAAYNQSITIPVRSTYHSNINSLNSSNTKAIDIPLMTTSTPASQSAYRASEYITPSSASPQHYHRSLYASSPKFLSPYMAAAASPPDHFHVGYDQVSLINKRGSRNSWNVDLEGSGASPNTTNHSPARSQSYPAGFYGAYSSSPKGSAPISIPVSHHHQHQYHQVAAVTSAAARPAVGSSSYFDLVDRYCFYESSPHTSPYSSYPNSPPAPCIRG
ncbi:hypothetical protein EDD11_005423 [Mortierella claussenii]|nr:hypothetical protein EDD11_005423 [Mortierella claussenii]